MLQMLKKNTALNPTQLQAISQILCSLIFYTKMK